jgi:hypothetical protein
MDDKAMICNRILLQVVNIPPRARPSGTVKLGYRHKAFLSQIIPIDSLLQWPLARVRYDYREG